MAKVRGMDEVLRNLSREIDKIDGHTLEGMREATLFVQGEAMEITPQRTGFLLGTAYSGAEKSFLGRILGRVGYTAKYAPHVHEMPDETNWTKPTSGNKFLEKAVKNNLKTVLDILRDRAKIR